MLSKEFDQGINCAGKLVYWVARFSYLLVLKRRFSNLLYLDLELFSIFGERNRILYTNGVFIKNLPNFFRFLVFLPSSRIKAFRIRFPCMKCCAKTSLSFCSVHFVQDFERRRRSLLFGDFQPCGNPVTSQTSGWRVFLRCFDAKYMILNCTGLDDCPPKYVSC